MCICMLVWLMIMKVLFCMLICLYWMNIMDSWFFIGKGLRGGSISYVLGLVGYS